MKKLYFLLFLPSLAFAHFADWDKQQQRLWYSYVALNVIDTFQTFDLIEQQKDPLYLGRETNPLLGNRPSKESLIILKLGINYMAYRVLDNHPKARTMTLGIMNGIYLKTVAGNHEAGFRVTFKF